MIDRMMYRYGKSVSWDCIRSAMRKEFVPLYYQDEQFKKLVMLKQGHKSVKEYIQEFEILVRRSELNESPGRLSFRFMKGLSNNIAKRLGYPSCLTLEETIQAALWAELAPSMSEASEKLR